MRNHLLGGTDAASLLGLGRVSPAVLYLRLRGELSDDFEGNEATDAGHLFEDHVAVPMAKKHLGIELVRPSTMTLALPDEPRIGASYDFEVDKSDALADIKLTGSRAKWGEPGSHVPVDIAAQMQFGMAVARRAGRVVPCIHVLAMFLPGFTMQDFPVEEDREVGDALIDRARLLLAQVDSGTPPEAGSEADARALFLGRRGQTIVATGEIVELVQALRHHKATLDEATEMVQELRDKILPFMGDATELVSSSGEVLATFRPNRVLDHEMLRRSHPDKYHEAGKVVTTAEAIERVLGKAVVENFKRDPIQGERATRVFKLKD